MPDLSHGSAARALRLARLALAAARLREERSVSSVELRHPETDEVVAPPHVTPSQAPETHLHDPST